MHDEIGPVMLDLIGPTLSHEERDLLQNPLVGGIILFTRNYVSIQQLTELCYAIREARQGPILIAVDHEGGRVQRFREGFTRIPSMGSLGLVYEKNPEEALQLAEVCGWIMASELLAVGIDLSFAPVLDLNKMQNQVIGDRSFHRNPQNVIALAKAFIQGMHAAGMAATGKHFPGHGSVNVDSHVAEPKDLRSLAEVMTDDIKPFMALSADLDAIMPAHIVFPEIDNQAVGFSEYWLQTILRTQLQFTGTIFSDDLNMKGANVAGDYATRAEAALQAGCDMVLICNNRTGAENILTQLSSQNYKLAAKKFKILHENFSQTFDELRATQMWQIKHELLTGSEIWQLATI